jgi:hypothetical protein
MPHRNAHAPDRLQAEDRRYHAVLLRLRGASFRTIASTLRKAGHAPPHYSERHAWRDVVTALERQRSESTEEIELARILELERLDDLFAKLWPKALAGDYMAFDRVVGLMGLRARLLGLYAPPSTNTDQTAQVGGEAVTVLVAWDDGTDLLALPSREPAA